MTVPTYEDFMLPTLRVLADGQPRATRATAEAAADLLDLDADAREEAIPSGLLTYVSRGQWAQTYLVQAGLIARPKRGTVTITDDGRGVLANPPTRIDSAYLRRYPKFVEFLGRKQAPRVDPSPSDTTRPESMSATDVPPDELVGNAERANRAEVESDLLNVVLRLDPRRSSGSSFACSSPWATARRTRASTLVGPATRASTGSSTATPSDRPGLSTGQAVHRQRRRPRGHQRLLRRPPAQGG